MGHTSRRLLLCISFFLLDAKTLERRERERRKALKRRDSCVRNIVSSWQQRLDPKLSLGGFQESSFAYQLLRLVSVPSSPSVVWNIKRKKKKHMREKRRKRRRKIESSVVLCHFICIKMHVLVPNRQSEWASNKLGSGGEEKGGPMWGYLHAHGVVEHRGETPDSHRSWRRRQRRQPWWHTRQQDPTKGEAPPRTRPETAKSSLDVCPFVCPFSWTIQHSQNQQQPRFIDPQFFAFYPFFYSICGHARPKAVKTRSPAEQLYPIDFIYSDGWMANWYKNVDATKCCRRVLTVLTNKWTLVAPLKWFRRKEKGENDGWPSRQSMPRLQDEAN